MGEPKAEAFADWLIPSDMIEVFYQRGEPEPMALVIAMLSDGLLRSGARRLVVDGRDLGKRLIPRELWQAVSRTDVWKTDRFRLSGQRENGTPWSVSAYDVRIDPNAQTIPPPVPGPPPQPAQKARGRLPASWWDDLWVELCRQLYAGDLKPDSQAVIERAMHDWLAARGMEAGETTIRERARRLYRALTS